MEQVQEIRMVDCTVDMQWFNPDNNAAYIAIQSPSGRSIKVMRSELTKLPLPHQLVVKHCMAAFLKGKNGNRVIQLNIDQMRSLKAIEDLLKPQQQPEPAVAASGKPVRKIEFTPYQQAIVQLTKNGCKSCSTKLRIKAHKGWTGYYCPKCKSGGSIKHKNNKK